MGGNFVWRTSPGEPLTPRAKRLTGPCLRRYLINDACVLAGKPLVSGAALGTEGQITVYNHQGGPCYRCLHPKPLAGG